MKKPLIAVFACLLVGCTGYAPSPPDCAALDEEIAAADLCAPWEGIADKWADIRSEVCDASPVDCADLVMALEHAGCPGDATRMLGGACN